MYKEIGYGHVAEIYSDDFEQWLKQHVDLLRDFTLSLMDLNKNIPNNYSHFIHPFKTHHIYLSSHTSVKNTNWRITVVDISPSLPLYFNQQSMRLTYANRCTQNKTDSNTKKLVPRTAQRKKWVKLAYDPTN